MGELRSMGRAKIKMADRVGGGTPLSEIRLEEKRVALRRALKREYMRQGYDPAGSNATGKRVFDAAFYRWSAIHNSQEILVRNTVRNFGVYAVTFLIPVIVFAKILNRDQTEFERGCRAGEIGLNHPTRKPQWFFFWKKKVLFFQVS